MARRTRDTLVLRSHSGRLLTRAVAVLLLVCLAECATGSCLSYGHSCWGAHGKRSGAVARTRSDELSDWYLSSLLRRMNGVEDNAYPSRKLGPVKNPNRLSAIYRSDADTEGGDGKLFDSLAVPVDLTEEAHERSANGILTAKLMKMARDASDEN